MGMAVIWMFGTTLATGPVAARSMMDMLNQGMQSLRGQGRRGTAAAEPEISGGRREALQLGIVRVVQQLGRPGGCLNQAKFHIPLPEPLAGAQMRLRMAGLSGPADDLEVRMHRAAEERAIRTNPAARTTELQKRSSAGFDRGVGC